MKFVGSSSSDEEEQETELREVEREKTYTRHTSVLTFTDGDERRVEWDVMDHSGDTLVFKDYTGVGPTSLGLSTGIQFTARAKLLVSISNLRTMETVEREKESMTYATTEEVPVDE